MDKEPLRRFWHRLDKYKYLALVVLAGLVLLCWPSTQGNTPGVQSGAGATGPPGGDAVADVESRLTEALARTDGVGRVHVILTVGGSPTTIYAENKRSRSRNGWQDGAATSADNEWDVSKVLSSGASGGSQPVVESTQYPAFVGALVVCDGAGNPAVQLRVYEAVSSLTGLTTDKIAIVPMKQQ